MGDVYRARDRVLDRSVAVKLLRSIAVSETERARFTDEARTLALLSHPGLVTILDAATTDDEPYLVMELIHGQSLAESCRGGALEPAHVAAIGAQLADALGHAHAAGVVHRDLKPGNVLLGSDGRALLADFGLARLMSDSVRHTTDGVAVGTAAYLAPEQVCGEDITPAADVYSLGLVLLEALTGERAYQGMPIEAALARLTMPPVIPDALPSRWHVLLRAMTAREPAARPSTDEVAASMRDLASGLDPAVATAALRAEPVHQGPSLVPVSDDSSGGEATRAIEFESTPQPWSSRIVGHWRWVVVATAAVALFALVGPSLSSDDQPGTSTPTVTASRELNEPQRDFYDRLPALSQADHRSVVRPGTTYVESALDGDGGDQPAQPQDEGRLEASRGEVEVSGGAVQESSRVVEQSGAAAEGSGGAAEGSGGAAVGSGGAAQELRDDVEESAGAAEESGGNVDSEPEVRGNSRAEAARASNRGRGNGRQNVLDAVR
jgi:serine/threonine protein kinase